jgi:hypothetical protein
LPFILMTSETDNFEKLQSTYAVPTVLVGNSTIRDWTPSSVISIVYPILRSANDTPLRVLGDRGHIYIGHGGSDKVVSAHRLYRPYDRFCVPGQAGADLFEFNRIGVRPHFLELVGRPQVSELQVRADTDGDHKVKTVLYAPTWSGLHVDDQNSSITRGLPIVRALAARGYTIIFRPHPLSVVKNPLSSNIDDRPWVEPIDQFLRANDSGTGQAHMTSDVTGRMSFAECANMSDALVADISSVVVDYLVTNKPIGVNSNYANLEDFYRAKPFARSVYAIERDLSNLGAVLDAFRTDPTRSECKKLQKLYLGDRTPEQQVDYFVEKMRGLILRGRELGVD